MTALAWLGFVAGAATVLGTLASVVVTLVVPRATRSRLVAALRFAIRGALRSLVSRRASYEERDRILSMGAPAFLVAQLLMWVLLIYAGFALMFWPLTGPSFPQALTVAGSSIFTLGFATSPGAAPLALTFLAAGCGLIVVALQIAYLPTIYSAFNRRETLVTMLESRAGVPSWGPEILARHELIDNVSSLADLYARWEEWAADLAESHSTYPSLIYFRSPHPLRSWITGLLSVLDAGALHLSLNPLSAPAQARPFMRMGIMALREMARVLELEFNPDPRPEDDIRLTREEFGEALDVLTSAGWRAERDPDEAWIHFRGWRVNYEQIVYSIADLLDAPPALWSGPRNGFAARHPEVIAPQRPPHRAPNRAPVDERREWREVTDRRRAVRAAAEAEPAGSDADQPRHGQPDAADEATDEAR
jgi:hypothetical protein